MALIPTSTGFLLTFILGVTNLIGLVLVFFSCRCMMGRKLTEFLWQKKWYLKFYNYHCYYWKFFMISVVLHAVVAFISFGLPFNI